MLSWIPFAILALGSLGNIPARLTATIHEVPYATSSTLTTADIRTFGAKCDGITDDTAALQAAISNLPPHGGVVYVPGREQPCYIGRASQLRWPTFKSGGSGQLLVAGSMSVGQTLILGNRWRLQGNAGGDVSQFQSGGTSASISAPRVAGVLGTALGGGAQISATISGGKVSAITVSYGGTGYQGREIPLIFYANTGGSGAAATCTVSGGAVQSHCTIAEGGSGYGSPPTVGISQTFTPNFSNGSISNVSIGSVLSLSAKTECGGSTISFKRLRNSVTATAPVRCRIPEGTNLTVFHATDPSFNGTHLVITSDYGGEGSTSTTWTWKQAGPESAATGMVNGYNEDGFESVTIDSVSGDTVTAYVKQAHASTDAFGMGAVAFATKTYTDHAIEDINITNCSGVCLFMRNGAMVHLTHFGTSPAANLITGGSVELQDVFDVWIDHSSLFAQPNGLNVPWGLRFTSSGDTTNDIPGLTWIRDSYIMSGVKIDTNGLSRSMNYNLEIENVVVEQPMRAAISIDGRFVRSGVLPGIRLRDVFLQDNFKGYRPALIAYTDPACPACGAASLRATSGVLSGILVNKYFTGTLTVDGMDAGATVRSFPGTPFGTLSDGKTLEAELRGEGANLGPSVIPHATKSVSNDPAAWTCAGTGCSINTGIEAPDGTMTAGEVVSGASGNSYVQAYAFTTTTAAGDWFCFGGWERQGEGQTKGYANSGQFGGAWVLTSSSKTEIFSNGHNYIQSAPFQTALVNDWWHPVAVCDKTMIGDPSSHTLSFRLFGGGSRGESNRFWGPWFMHIPAKEGFTDDEVQRWRQTLLHGFVPSAIPASALAMNPSHKLYWGNDTNLYRSAANTLKTDDAFISSRGVQIGSVGTLIDGEYKGSGKLNFTSISAPGCQEQMLTIPGAIAGDQCAASTGANDIGESYYYGGCRVSASNTAQVKVCATSTGTPKAVIWTGWARH